MAALQASLLLCKLPLSPHSSSKRFSPIRALDRPNFVSDLRFSNFNLRRSRSRVASVPCSIRPENSPSSDSEEASRRRNRAVVLLMAVGVAISGFYQKFMARFDLEPLRSFLALFGLEKQEVEFDGKGSKSTRKGKTFEDVKGCDEAKRELEEVVEFLKNPEKFTRLGGKLPKGILLQGPPGTGKTLLAKAIAGEAGVPLLLRSGSEFEEMFVGVGSRRIRSLFKEARKKAPCIIFIDEIDTVGSNRADRASWYSHTLNQLLAEMDGFKPNEGIILIAATNLVDVLDPALTRPGRFDRHITVPSPDVKGREEILELYMQDKPLGDDIDVKSLARGTPGFNGADLENLLNIAATRAAVEGADKISAAHMEFAKDQILMGTARKSRFLSEETKKLTAYHESGHTIVSLNTEGADPIHKVTIVPHGSALGMVTLLPEKDEMLFSKKQLLAHIDVCMGGRAAEELIFGKDYITTGASHDLKSATRVARYMVSSCGMSDEIGPVHVKERPSSEMQSRIDTEVEKFLREAYDRVKVLLKKHEKELHTLANSLLEHETLGVEEIKRTLLPSTGGQVPEQQEEPAQEQVGDLVQA